MTLRFAFNSPVVLVFALICCVATALDTLCSWPSVQQGLTSLGIATHDRLCFTVPFFAAWPWAHFRSRSVLSWLRLVTHVFGHNSIEHLSGNMQLLLVVGPTCEEKYGSRVLMRLLVITAVASAATHMVFSADATVLMGASGVVFMLVAVNSFVNFRVGRVPLTSVLTALLFVGKELSAMRTNPKGGISFLAHLTGGVAGAVLGYLVNLGLARKVSRGMSARNRDSGVANAPGPVLTPQRTCMQAQPMQMQAHMHAA